MTTHTQPQTTNPAHGFDVPRLDAFCSSGPSPTLHLIGPGNVGRALLGIVARSELRLVGVTDSTATCYAELGLDARSVARFKASQRGLGEQPEAKILDIATAIDWVDADIVIDATATRFDRPDWGLAIEGAVFSRGARLVASAKDAVCDAADRWLDPSRLGDVGINAVLGGTGRSLLSELAGLRTRCRAVALAGNASTTAILSVIEAGGTLDEGLQRARQRGYLEPDPELDLRGADAAVKLAIVAGALWGRAIDPATIPCQDLRDVDLEPVRARPARGETTRLVGRVGLGGQLSVGYEGVPVSSPLAVPCDRVVYTYELNDGSVRTHVGRGVGALNTARALWADVQAFAGRVEPATSVTLTRGSGLHHLPLPFYLQHGGELPGGQLAFELGGVEGAPLVIVQGSLSAGRQIVRSVLEKDPPAWQGVVGAGKTVDLDRKAVLSVDYLGGRGCSTGPGCSRGGEALPTVSVRDQARAIGSLLDRLGVERVAAFVGSSYGAQVGASFARRFPRKLGNLIVVGDAAPSPGPEVD